MKTYRKILFFVLIVSFTACDLIVDQNIFKPPQTVYYWISADTDTYVECVMAGGGCVPVEANYSGRSLVTANSRLGIKRSYFDFPMPDFPVGTTIQEAYVEMYHSGTNEDGKSDKIDIEIDRIRKPWNANEVHYNNQPADHFSGGEFKLSLKSNNWSGTQSIGREMNQIFENPAAFHGFVAYIRNFEPGYEKGYYSNNDKRTVFAGLRRAPRLLLKVELPEGTDVQDIDFTERHIDVNGSTIFGVAFQQSENWPSEWKVAAYQ